jgi:hypothetical protein
MIPAIDSLTQAFEELEEWCNDHALVLADHELPSALVVTVDPRSTPNGRGRICGDPDTLVRALLMAARGNEAFRDSLTDALPQIMHLASQRA